ncbi:MAG: alternative oxidase [Acidimicrobiales bacterium]
MAPIEPTVAHTSGLRALQEETLSTPRLSYSLPARALFTTLDVLYGRRRSLSKFRVLEVLARVPYQAWERVGYVAVTHTHPWPAVARRVFTGVEQSRAQQDNEQWHLLILEELIRRSRVRESFLWYRLLPQVLAAVTYHFAVVLFVLKPAWAYRLNAELEDHAEHEYMLFVQENADFEAMPFVSAFSEDYGDFASLADFFRQVGVDERGHKLESLEAMQVARVHRVPPAAA